MKTIITIKDLKDGCEMILDLSKMPKNEVKTWKCPCGKKFLITTKPR